MSSGAKDQTLSSNVASAAHALWHFLAPQRPRMRSDVVVGLGCSDISVAVACVDVLRERHAPLVVFSGANSKDTAVFFPDGEAEHFARHARALGAASEQLLVEPRATNTEENLRFTRKMLAARRVRFRDAMLATRPYHQLRALGTAKRVWPDIDVHCTSIRASLEEYIRMIDDADRVLNSMVGEVQRLEVYADEGLVLSDPVPGPVREAARALAALGYVHRLLPGRTI